MGESVHNVGSMELLSKVMVIALDWSVMGEWDLGLWAVLWGWCVLWLPMILACRWTNCVIEKVVNSL